MSLPNGVRSRLANDCRRHEQRARNDNKVFMGKMSLWGRRWTVVGVPLDGLARVRIAKAASIRRSLKPVVNFASFPTTTSHQCLNDDINEMLQAVRARTTLVCVSAGSCESDGRNKIQHRVNKWKSSPETLYFMTTEMRDLYRNVQN